MPRLLATALAAAALAAFAVPTLAQSSNEDHFENLYVRVTEAGGHHVLLPVPVAARLCGLSPVTLINNMSQNRESACTIGQNEESEIGFPHLRQDIFHGDN